MSPSSRRAWIEIRPAARSNKRTNVALLAEGVDRNRVLERVPQHLDASPSSRRAWIEIMHWCRNSGMPRVALLAEGVDRNTGCCVRLCLGRRSPSSRRAWIEMAPHPLESLLIGSPSSRRAWIEISVQRLQHSRRRVALLAEGVDRNICAASSTLTSSSRPPRGGRG